MFSALWLALLVGGSCYDRELLYRIAASEGDAPHQKSGNEPDLAYDPTWHRLELEVDPAIRAISGIVTPFRITDPGKDAPLFSPSAG